MAFYPKLTFKDYICLPHGKVADTSLPPDWKEYVGDNLSKFVKQENGDTVADGPFGAPLCITSVPPRSPTGPDDPAGHTEFLYLSEETRNKVFNYPGFPQPVTNPKVPRHEVREAPGKGLGVFATCDMHVGDFIWAERPFIVTSSATIPPKGTHIGDHHTEAQANALRLYAGERTQEAIINRLTPERKARFMTLANSHKEDGSGPISAIVRTNQLAIGMVEGETSNPEDAYFRYTAVADDLSRTNHSCIPNIGHIFDFASFSLRIYAYARIKKGDELVWSYVGRHQSTLLRQKDLSPYGFQCNCRMCEGRMEPYTEKKWESLLSRSYVYSRHVMEDLLKEDNSDNPFHKKSPADKEERLALYRVFIWQLDILRWESDSFGNTAELNIFCLLHELYKRVGNQAKRRRYANLVVRWMKCLELDHLPYI